jgi:hypothetical protein
MLRCLRGELWEDPFDCLEKRVKTVNADAEGNVNIPGHARFPVKKNGLSAPYALYFQMLFILLIPFFLPLFLC